ncbi:MAG: hypothetical protein AAF497_16805, partial [Planctomycetota bacterium]
AKTDIVSLCEQYSIVSEYASFIVLENDAEYRRWNIERRNLSRSTRDRNAQERVRKELQRLREKAMAKLGPPADEKTVAGRKAVTGPKPSDLATGTPGSRPTSETKPSRRRDRGIDLDFGGRSRSNGGGGGGGAFDPITGILALGLGGLGWWQNKRKK